MSADHVPMSSDEMVRRAREGVANQPPRTEVDSEDRETIELEPVGGGSDPKVVTRVSRRSAPPAPPSSPRPRQPAPVSSLPTGPLDASRGSRRGLILAVALAVAIAFGFFVLSSSDDESTPVTNDPIVGTWHQRDAGTSNIFYFVDPAVGGVYPIVYYDDFTNLDICGDNGPMLWSGFMEETASNTFSGSFGNYWCPDNGDGVHEDPFGLGVVTFRINYHSGTDTMSGGIGGCEGARQSGLDSPNEAARRISEGGYPPPDAGGSC